MIRRYPHTVKISTSSQTQDANGDFLNETLDNQLKGRYEPNNQSGNMDYTGKFYCSKFEVDSFKLDESTLEYQGRKFKIVQLFKFQRHCELWLS